MTEIKYKAKMIVLLSFLLFTTNIFSMTVLNEVKVKGEKVTLNNLIWTTDEELIKSFSKVEVGSIKVPGSKIIIRKSTLEGLLLPYDKDLNIPDKVVVERAYQSIAKEEIIEGIEASLDVIYADTDFDYDITISGGDKLRMPLGQLRYVVDNKSFDKGLGRKSLTLLVYEGDKQVYKVPFSVNIGKYRREYILKKDVKKGEKFDLDKVEVKEEFVYQEIKLKTLTFDSGDIFTADLLAGTTLENKHLMKDTFVKVGERIVIYIKFGNMYITDSGRALDNGDVGDVIRVENLRSGKIVKGTIKDDKSIEASSK